jgi:CubicO group peptidase (beta-lactamase class C family)
MLATTMLGLGLAHTAAATLGPGPGAWEVSTPEAEGLSTEALTAAADATQSALGGRVCYLVVKNGKIVFERYTGAGAETRQQSAFSATKSMCASLFGIAQQQGFVDTELLVSEATPNTLLCSAEAQFKHVMTMSGTSPNLPESPRYSVSSTQPPVLRAACDALDWLLVCSV